jgi:hypothetical protein
VIGRDTVNCPRYNAFLRDLKERICSTQLHAAAAVAVNRELIALYWQIGQSIIERQQTEGWGTAVIDRLGKDLQAPFPGLSGLSRPNVYRMRAFYLAHAGPEAFLSRPGKPWHQAGAARRLGVRQLLSRAGEGKAAVRHR